MQIKPATAQQRSDIVALLQRNQLPYGDLPAELNGFLVACAGEKVIGAIGLEQYLQSGLLRSMVVDAAYRNQKIAATLVSTLEQNARDRGVTDVFLLTETADSWFQHRGYTRINRDEVPSALMASSEFRHVCPASAIIMKKKIAQQDQTNP